MKFIVMTGPGLDNNFVDELIKSKLLPAMIVTNSPFYCGKINPFKFLVKKGLLILKYLVKRSVTKRKYQAYFLAKKYSIPIWHTQKVNNDEFAKLIIEMGIDYAFIFTFGILKENIFRAPKFGCINFHPALLPLNRGACPSNWAIRNNQHKTGITFHFISKSIDAGSIIEQYEIPLSGYETAKILNQYLFSIGATLFVRLIFRLKFNFKYNLINNDILKGTHEPPFGTESSIISDKNTFQEISLIIRASQIYELCAVYRYLGKEYMVINCIDLTDCNLTIKEYPFFDDENNIYLKSKDNKVVFLVTKYSQARYKFSRFIYNIISRSIYPAIILFLLLTGKLL
jgi:methionyl-tRNA formyltransferase